GLGVAIALLTAALWGALRLEKSSEQALDRLRTRQTLADQFRADVAQAAEAPERWKQDVAGSSCLILAGENRHVVYRWKDQRLLRFESVGEKTQERDVPVGFGPNWQPGPSGGPPAVIFDRSSVGGRLLTLRLFNIRENGGKVPLLEITAALGGDRQ